jgi:hypothetical protein
MGCAGSTGASVHAEHVSEQVNWSSKLPVAGSVECELPRHFTIRIQKGAGNAIGASLASVPSGAVLVSTQEGGVLDRWNKDNPDKAVRPGFIFEEVNGVSGYWPLLESLQRSATPVVKVATGPPKGAPPNWFEDIAVISRGIEQSDNRGPVMLQLPQQDPTSSTDRKVFASLPSVVAHEANVDQCAICLEDVGPEEVLTQLPCSHAYHSLCAARWLSQCAPRGGSTRHSCPLCCRRLVYTGEGLIAVEADCASPSPWPVVSESAARQPPQ